MKLVYFSHGFMLATHDRSLISDEVQAWDYGPVIPEIYEAFKEWQGGPIGKVTYVPKPFSKDEQAVIDRTFEIYGRFCGYYLSQITHDDGIRETPWAHCYEEGQNNTIPNDVTKQYYKKIVAGN